MVAPEALTARSKLSCGTPPVAVNTIFPFGGVVVAGALIVSAGAARVTRPTKASKAPPPYVACRGALVGKSVELVKPQTKTSPAFAATAWPPSSPAPPRQIEPRSFEPSALRSETNASDAVVGPGTNG